MIMFPVCGVGNREDPPPEPERRKLSKAEKKEQRKRARAEAKARARAAECAAMGDGNIAEAKTSGKSHVLPKEMLEDPHRLLMDV